MSRTLACYFWWGSLKASGRSERPMLWQLYGYGDRGWGAVQRWLSPWQWRSWSKPPQATWSRTRDLFVKAVFPFITCFIWRPHGMPSNWLIICMFFLHLKHVLLYYPGDLIMPIWLSSGIWWKYTSPRLNKKHGVLRLLMSILHSSQNSLFF